MNISSSVNLAQMGAADPQGANIRQDYGVAVAMKVRDQVKQEGQAIVKLIDSAPAPSADGAVGQNLRTFA